MNTLSLELARLFRSKEFLIALGIGCAICVAHIVQFVVPEYQESQLFPPSYPLSAFTRWIGGWSYPVHPALFFFLLPLIAALPYGGTFYTDYAHGYLTHVLVRTTWNRYFFSKVITVFISGGIVVTIPLVVNFIGTACLLPLIQPDVVGIGNFMILPFSFAGDLFFNNALLYIAMYLILIFATSGAIACLSIPLGYFMPNKALSILAPFIVCTIAAQALQSSDFYSFAPTLFTMPGQDYGPLNPVHVFCFFLCVFLSLALFIRHVAHKDYLQ